MTKAKGNNFERLICKKLSMWWSQGERDDIFWRSATSGGMAKVRSKQGKKTFGQYGDIQATDPIGQPLIDLCAIELKRGYKRNNIADVLDKMPNSSIQEWEKWVFQVMEDVGNAGVPYWMLITKRDGRTPLIFMPYGLFQFFTLSGSAQLKISRPYVIINPVKIKDQEKIGKVFGTTLKEFFKNVHPDSIIAHTRKG